jgi:hypothetical protein
MSNLCSTTITINGDSDDVERLGNLIEKAQEQLYINTMSKGRWLGNICIFSGISSVNDAINGKPRCKGEIDCFDCYDDNSLTIYTSTAWVPMLEMWKLIIDKHFPKMDIIYSCEEPSQGLYWTNDPTLVGERVYDSWYKFVSLEDVIANE